MARFQALFGMLKINKKVASTVAIHFGLILGVVIYTLIGAFSMQWLESPARVAAMRIKREVAIPPPQKIVKVFLGSEISNADPGVHSCLRFVLQNVFNKTRCQSHEMDHLNIQAIDSCYQFANFRKLGIAAPKIFPSSTTTPIPITEAPEPPKEEEKWSFGNALIFAFTVITTIGYGHVAPETIAGRVFVIVYGVIGVPLTLLTIADLGMFISLCLKKLIAAINKAVWWMKKTLSGKKKKNPEKEEIVVTVSEHKSALETGRSESAKGEEEEGGEEEEEEEKPEEPVGRGQAESIALCTAFTAYLFFGAQVLSAYEPEMDFFKALYFNFVTLTTIGLGDFVPKSFDYLFITLVYIGIGLALTTMAIEIAADLLKKVHYAGRKMENVANAMIWFGGKKMTMKALVKNLGDKFNIPPDDLANFNFDQFAENAMKVQAGEMKTLRTDAVPEEGEVKQRAVSYSNIRGSMDAHSIGFMDENRLSRTADTVRTDREQTFRTQDTLPIFYEINSIDGKQENVPRLDLDTPYESDTSSPSSFDIAYLKTMSTHKRY